MKRYYRKNRSSVALFLVSNLLAAGSSVFRETSRACGKSRL